MTGVRMVRVLIDTVTAAAGKLMEFSGRGRTGETISRREVLQQYGLQSRPPSGAEGIVLRQGNWLVLLATDGREYRLALEDGEVAVVTTYGDKIHIMHDGTIEIAGSSKVVVNSPTVEIGQGALEAIINGETFQALFNAHTHTGGFVSPTSPPVAPMVPGVHTSLSVKAAK